MGQLAAPQIADSADVDERARIGAGTLVWHLVQVREDAVVGEQCVISRGAYIGPGVSVGDRCKIQNHALVYEPAVLEDGVFIGPAAVLTNDLFPARGDARRHTEDRCGLAPGRQSRPHRSSRRRPRGVHRPGHDRTLGHGGRRRSRDQRRT